VEFIVYHNSKVDKVQKAFEQAVAFLQRIIDHPSDQKYRCINPSSKLLLHLLSCVGGVELLLAIGFTTNFVAGKEGDRYLLADNPDVAGEREKLASYVACLRQKLGGFLPSPPEFDPTKPHFSNFCRRNTSSEAEVKAAKTLQREQAAAETVKNQAVKAKIIPEEEARVAEAAVAVAAEENPSVSDVKPRATSPRGAGGATAKDDKEKPSVNPAMPMNNTLSQTAVGRLVLEQHPSPQAQTQTRTTLPPSPSHHESPPTIADEKERDTSNTNLFVYMLVGLVIAVVVKFLSRY